MYVVSLRLSPLRHSRIYQYVHRSTLSSSNYAAPLTGHGLASLPAVTAALKC